MGDERPDTTCELSSVGCRQESRNIAKSVISRDTDAKRAKADRIRQSYFPPVLHGSVADMTESSTWKDVERVEVGMVAQERMRLPRDRVVRGRDASSELSTRLIHLPFSTAQPQRTVTRVSPRNHLYGSAVGMVNAVSVT